MKLNLLEQYINLDDLTVPDFFLELSKDDVSSLSESSPELSISGEKYAREDLSVFFTIGMTINIVMVIAFFIWGIKQWKKNGTRKE